MNEYHRNTEIASRYLKEEISITQLAREYDLSRVRIRQIVMHFEREWNLDEERKLAFENARSVEDIPIKYITDLPVRVLHCFLNENLQTVGEVIKLPDSELFRIPNLGKVSLDEWKLCLRALTRNFNRRNGIKP